MVIFQAIATELCWSLLGVTEHEFMPISICKYPYWIEPLCSRLSPGEAFVRRAILRRITKWPWKINRFHIIRLFLFLSKSWWSGNLSHAIKSKPIGGFHAISADTNNAEWWNEQMLVDKESELMSDLLYTVHQHRGDDVTWKPPIWQNNLIALF